MKVIELIGGPGSGKTTTAARLWGHLKRLGVYAEYVREPAQEEIYARQNLTTVSQLFLSASLYQKLNERKQAGVAVVIIDTPILGPFIYENQSGRRARLFSLISQEFRDNFDIQTVLIKRSEFSVWRQAGRNQGTLEQASEYDSKTETIYRQHNINFITAISGVNTDPEALLQKLEYPLQEDRSDGWT